MIAFLATFLIGRGISAAIVRFLAPAIVYAIIAGVALTAWHFVAERYRNQGRAEIQTKWNRAVEEERERVRDAVAEALANAEKAIAALEKKEDELNVALEQARAEAATDPNAAKCGIGRDGVRRHKRLWKDGAATIRGYPGQAQASLPQSCGPA